MKNTRRLLVVKLGEMVLDCLLVLTAFVFAYVARTGQFSSTDFPFWPFFQIALLMTPVFWLFFVWSGLYTLHEKTVGELFRIVSFSCLSGAMLFVLVFFFKREIFFSRSIVLLVWCFASIMVFALHFFLQKNRQNAHRDGEDISRTLIIGNGRAAETIIRNLRQNGSRFQAVAILAPYGGGQKEVEGVKVLGKLDALEQTVVAQRIDAVLQTEAAEQTVNLLAFAEGKFLEFLMAPSILGAFHRPLSSEKIAGIPFLRLESSPIFGWGQFFKRALDACVSAVVLLFAAPVLLFKPKTKVLRISGAGGHTFKKYEFTDTNGFFRCLPEFINVFRGEMSLVGPRPRPPEDCEKLKPHERKRLIMRPGIFGPWQLLRLQNRVEGTGRQIEMDIRYVLTWSFVGDLKILYRSLKLLFSPEGKGGFKK